MGLVKQKRRKSKAIKGRAKGMVFERVFCKTLSLWWTNKRQDDIFWRTSGSGSRAAQRKDRRTFGQTGDVQAADPIGQPLIDLFLIELKRGYKHESLARLITSKGKPCQMLAWIAKIQKECPTTIKDGVCGRAWMLVVKQDYKDVILLTPYRAWHQIRTAAKKSHGIPEIGCFIVRLPAKTHRAELITITTLPWFLQHVKPEHIRYALRYLRQDEH